MDSSATKLNSAFRMQLDEFLVPRSAVLVLGQSSFYSFLHSSLFSQVESLLQNGRLAEAEELLKRAAADPAHGSTSSGDQVSVVCDTRTHSL